MLKINPQQLLDSNIKPFSLPVIVAQVNQMANDPTASAADIAQTISQDSALTAQLLKIINSPFYRFPAKIESLGMAVTVLGTRQLRDLVISASVIKRFRDFSDPEFDSETFWCHSITTGIAARAIALKLMMANSERFFVTGLLHDIGKPFLHQTLPDAYSILERELAKPDCDLENIERQVLGFTHDELGAGLIRAWQFPENISIPVYAHAMLETGNQYEKDTALLHLANHIANNLQAPISRDDDVILNPRAVEILHLTPDMMGAIYEDTYRHLDELLDIFYYRAVT